MEKPTQTLFGSIFNDSGWHVAIYAVWRLRLGTGRGGLDAVLSLVAARHGPGGLRAVQVAKRIGRQYGFQAFNIDSRTEVGGRGEREGAEPACAVPGVWL